MQCGIICMAIWNQCTSFNVWANNIQVLFSTVWPSPLITLWVTDSLRYCVMLCVWTTSCSHCNALYGCHKWQAHVNHMPASKPIMTRVYITRYHVCSVCLSMLTQNKTNQPNPLVQTRGNHASSLAQQPCKPAVNHTTFNMTVTSTRLQGETTTTTYSHPTQRRYGACAYCRTSYRNRQRSAVNNRQQRQGNCVTARQACLQAST